MFVTNILLKLNLEKKKNIQLFFSPDDIPCGCGYLCHAPFFPLSLSLIFARGVIMRETCRIMTVFSTPSSTCTGLIGAVSPAERLPI